MGSRGGSDALVPPTHLLEKWTVARAGEICPLPSALCRVGAAHLNWGCLAPLGRWGVPGDIGLLTTGVLLALGERGRGVLLDPPQHPGGPTESQQCWGGRERPCFRGKEVKAGASFSFRNLVLAFML